MKKLALFTLLLTTVSFAQQKPKPPAFRPYVAEQIVLFSQPGYKSPESLTSIGATYRIDQFAQSRFTLFTVTRIRVDQRFHSINFVNGGSFRLYKGFTVGGTASYLNTWTTIAGKPAQFTVLAPNVSLGYVAPKWRVLAFRAVGGSAPRAGQDLWDFQGEYKLNKRFSLLGDVQMYQYKYPSLVKSPRSRTAEVDLGLKYYFR